MKPNFSSNLNYDRKPFLEKDPWHDAFLHPIILETSAIDGPQGSYYARSLMSALQKVTDSEVSARGVKFINMIHWVRSRMIMKFQRVIFHLGTWNKFVKSLPAQSSVRNTSFKTSVFFYILSTTEKHSDKPADVTCQCIALFSETIWDTF